MIGAAARRFDFGARACGFSLETVMMVMMPPNHLIGPGERRLVLEADRLRPAIDMDRAAFRETEPGKIAVSVRQA